MIFKKREKKGTNIILLVSIQKCGTHLVQKILNSLGYTPVGFGDELSIYDLRSLGEKEYAWTHFCPGDSVLSKVEETDNIKVIFNYRDPRASIASWVNWVGPENKLITHSNREYIKKVHSRLGIEERYLNVINKSKLRKSEYNVLEWFEWCRVLLYHPKVFNLQFEKIVGSKGGGCDNDQLQTIASLTDFLELSDDKNSQIISELFGGTETFRKGRVDEFRSSIPQRILEEFNCRYEKLLKEYNYEL